MAMLDEALAGKGMTGAAGVHGESGMGPWNTGTGTPQTPPNSQSPGKGMHGEAALSEILSEHVEFLASHTGEFAGKADRDPIADWRAKLPAHLLDLLERLEAVTDKAAQLAEQSEPAVQWTGRPGSVPAPAGEQAELLRAGATADEVAAQRVGMSAEADLAGRIAALRREMKTDGDLRRDPAATRDGNEPPEASRGKRDLPTGAQSASMSLASSMLPGRAEPPAMPELVATALATLQSLGEDAAGLPRFALPNAAALPNGADPAGQNLAARTAIPGVAAEILSQARNGARKFEIRLDPPELGRIEVTLDFRRDGGMAAKLVVERPETLEMLLRDARGLEKTLQQGGLKLEDGAVHYQLRDQSAFERERQPGSGHASRPGEDGGRPGEEADASSDPPGKRRAIALGAIDIRV